MTNSNTLTPDTYAVSSNLAALSKWKKKRDESDYSVYALKSFLYALVIFTITVLRKDRDKLRATLLKSQSRVGMVLTDYEKTKSPKELEAYIKARTADSARMADAITQFDAIYAEGGYQAVLEAAAPFIEELGLTTGIQVYATAKAITSNATCPKEFADCKVHIKMPESKEHACWNIREVKPKTATQTVTSEANDTDIPF